MKSLFPGAKFFGPKRSEEQSKVSLKDIKEASFQDTEVIFLEGNKALSESCFYHRPTQTLFVTDLFFNVKDPQGFSFKALLTIGGAYKKLATSRLLKLSTKDKTAFKNSIQKLIHLKPKVVVPCHGEPISYDEFLNWSKTF